MRLACWTSCLIVCWVASALTSGNSDPCAGAADPLQCRYQLGVALLGKLGDASSPSVAAHAPSQPADDAPVSLLEHADDSRKEVPAAQELPAALPSSVAPASLVVPAASAAPDPDAEVEALKGALEALEAPGSAGSSLDENVDELEDALEDLRAGSLAGFRAERLADVINRGGPPATAEQRAAQAYHFLHAVSWPADSQVPAIAAHLRKVASSSKPPTKSPATSLLQRFEDTISGWGGQLHQFLSRSQRCARDVHEC